VAPRFGTRIACAQAEKKRGRGTGDDQNAQNYLVPAGANFAGDVQGTTRVDETAVKPEVRKPLTVRHHKKAVAPQE
jgi:hypothetical protein